MSQNPHVCCNFQPCREVENRYLQRYQFNFVKINLKLSSRIFPPTLSQFPECQVSELSNRGATPPVVARRVARIKNHPCARKTPPVVAGQESLKMGSSPKSSLHPTCQQMPIFAPKLSGGGWSCRGLFASENPYRE
jgi:hypothetical protein